MKPIEIITGDTLYPAPFTHRVLILCEEKNLQYFITQINTEQKPEWFSAISPLGLIPVLRMENKIVFDSHSICEYLDTFSKPHLLPLDSYKYAQHKSWMMFADEIAQEIAQKVKQGNIIQADFTRLNLLFEILSKHMKGEYFFGKELSLVDIYLLSHMLWFDALEESVLSNSIINQFPIIKIWLSNMKERKSVKKTMGDNYSLHFIELLRKYDLIP